jgi:hypothetical protein
MWANIAGVLVVLSIAILIACFRRVSAGLIGHAASNISYVRVFFRRRTATRNSRTTAAVALFEATAA